MTYATEFPDFAADDLPAVVTGRGWTDISWRNDAMPKFIHEATGLALWCGETDPAARREDCPDRFQVEQMTWSEPHGWQHTAEVSLYAGDDEAPMLAVLLGEAFADVITGWLSSDQMTTVRRRNATSEYATACASHDFCDANMAMHEAFVAIMGRCPLPDEGEMADADCELWNAAWTYAKGARLTAKRGA